MSALSPIELETLRWVDCQDVARTCPMVNWQGSMVCCKRRDCARCGVTWAKAWETVIGENTAHYNGSVMLLSITAPGQDRLPWSCDRDHVHSGKRGCRVKDDAADMWAAEAPGNWRALRDAARLATKRALGVAPTILSRVWEPQKRGVPHLHVVLGVRTFLERRAADHFAAEVERLAPEYLFGEQVQLTKAMTAREAARYLCGYLLGRSKKKGTIRENIADPRMPRSLVWSTPALSSLSSSPRIVAMRERIDVAQGTGITIRTLRYARWALAVRNGRCAVFPKLYGEKMLTVARVLVRLDQSGRHAREDDDEELFQTWTRVLRAMRHADELRPEDEPIIDHMRGLARVAELRRAAA